MTNIESIPLEILVFICNDLSALDIYSFCRVNKRFYELLRNDNIWIHKVRKDWILARYDVLKMKERKVDTNCWDYFRMMKMKNKFVNKVICDIQNGTPDETTLSKVYSNFDQYVPYLLSQVGHIRPKFHHEVLDKPENEWLSLHEFKRIISYRSKNLNRCFISMKLLERGRFLKCLDMINSNKIDDWETFLVHISLLDTHFYDLILERDRFINFVISYYNKQPSLDDMTLLEKLQILVFAFKSIHGRQSRKRNHLHREIDPNYVPIKHCEDLSILRFYAGGSCGNSFIRASIIYKICRILGFSSNISMNENFIFIESSKVLYSNDELEFQLINISEIRPELKETLTCNQLNKKRKFQSFFRNHKSRSEDFKYDEKIIIPKTLEIESRSKVFCQRNSFLYDQLVGCFGTINLDLWKSAVGILKCNTQMETKIRIHKYTMFPSKPTDVVTENGVPEKNNILVSKYGDEGFLKYIDLPEKVQKSKEFFVGSLVVSESYCKVGVIVEILGKIVKSPSDLKIITNKGTCISIKEAPFFKVIFPIFGTMTVKLDSIKRFEDFSGKNMNCQVYELLMSDLIGEYFNMFDDKQMIFR